MDDTHQSVYDVVFNVPIQKVYNELSKKYTEPKYSFGVEQMLEAIASFPCPWDEGHGNPIVRYTNSEYEELKRLMTVFLSSVVEANEAVIPIDDDAFCVKEAKIIYSRLEVIKFLDSLIVDE
jgi:hypothetical protein